MAENIMKAQNPRRNQNGTIDIEIEHPVHGWITFTADPSDPEAHGREIYARIERGDYGEIAPEPKEGSTNE